jgi:hypothetical protein
VKKYGNKNGGEGGAFKNSPSSPFKSAIWQTLCGWQKGELC